MKRIMFTTFIALDNISWICGVEYFFEKIFVEIK